MHPLIISGGRVAGTGGGRGQRLGGKEDLEFIAVCTSRRKLRRGAFPAARTGDR